MKILSVKNNKQDTTFEVELDIKKWKEAFAKERKNLAKNIQVQGFRKGHVPANIIDERVSPQQVAFEALRKSENAFIGEIINQKEFKDSDCLDSVCNLEVVKLDADKSAPVLKVSFELVPKVEGFRMKDVKDIEIPPYKAPEIPEALVKGQIKQMLKNDAMVSVKNGPVAKGNIAVIDFKGFIDGKAFKGGEGKNFELEIGSKSFIDNFEDQLIGCKKGDKKDVNVTFPKDYGMKDYAGKPAKFEVEVKEVKEIEYPEINKDYLKKFGMEDVNNEKELEAHIKNLFSQETQMQYQDVVIRIINETIGKKAKLTYYPQSLLNMHKQQVANQYAQEAQRNGFKTLDAYKKALKLDDKQFEEALDKAARTTLIVAMVYEMLIQEYKLTVSEADKKDYISKLTRFLQGNKKQAEEMYEARKDMCESTILRDKLFKKVIEEAKKVEPKKPEAKEAKK